MELAQTRRDTVAHFVVDGGAYALRIAFKLIRSADRALGMREFPHDVIDVLGGHSCPDVLCDFVQHSGIDGAGAADAFDHCRSFDIRRIDQRLVMFPHLLHAFKNMRGDRFFLIDLAPE